MQHHVLIEGNFAPLATLSRIISAHIMGRVWVVTGTSSGIGLAAGGEGKADVGSEQGNVIMLTGRCG